MIEKESDLHARGFHHLPAWPVANKKRDVEEIPVEKCEVYKNLFIYIILSSHLYTVLSQTNSSSFAGAAHLGNFQCVE